MDDLLRKENKFLKEAFEHFKFLCEDALKERNKNILPIYLESVSKYIVQKYEYKMGIRKDPPDKLWNDGSIDEKIKYDNNVSTNKSINNILDEKRTDIL